MSRKHVNRGEAGFGLIELMVVVLIIGILLAIAVPAFLTAQRASKGRVAGVNAREAVSAGRVVYSEIGTFDSTAAEPFDLAVLKAAEPSLGWTAEGDESTGPQEVSWDSISSTEVRYAVMSKNGDCFLIRDSLSSSAGGGTTYGKNTNVATCRANDSATFESSSVAAGW